MIEPILGEGGFVVPAEGFLPAIAAWCRENGVLFVADEIQSGFCRTGEWFACDHEGVVPDLITTAKGIAGGLPLAAVTGRAEVMDAVHAGGLGGTYGGNPVACAAALGAIEEMRSHDLRTRARAVESLIRRRLDALAADHPVIGDIRGRGAMMAIELCAPGTTTPTPPARPRSRRTATPRASSSSPAAPGATSSASCRRSRSPTSCSRRPSTSSPRPSPPPPEPALPREGSVRAPPFRRLEPWLPHRRTRDPAQER